MQDFDAIYPCCNSSEKEVKVRSYLFFKTQKSRNNFKGHAENNDVKKAKEMIKRGSVVIKSQISV